MDKTILELPFAHELMLVPPRKRTPELVLVRSEIPVAIDTVSGDEAPVVAEIVFRATYDRMSPEARAASHPHGPVRRVFRSHAGRLFEQVGTGPVAPKTFAAELADPDSWVAGRRWSRPFDPSDYPVFESQRPWMHDRRHAMALPTPARAYERLGRGNVRLHKDFREEREPQARAVLEAGLAVIDGAMWVHHPHLVPRLRVVSQSRGVGIEFGMRADPLWYVHEFRLDAIEDARAVAAMEAETRGLPGYDDLLDTVEVRRPDLLPLDTAVEMAEQVRSAVSSGHRLPEDLVALFREPVAGRDDAIARLDRLQALVDALDPQAELQNGLSRAGCLANIAVRWARIERPRLDVQAAPNEDDALALSSISP